MTGRSRSAPPTGADNGGMSLSTLRYGMRSSAVLALQKQLSQLGHFKGPFTGYFGPITRGAVSSFERAKGLRRDGVADPAMRLALAAAVKKRATASSPAPASWKSAAAPPNDYRRVRYDGATMNVRTRTMLQRAERYARAMGAPGRFTVTQGSYHPGVGASAGTHDGGGALDIRIRGYSTATADKMVKALRMAGFAAWRRGVGDGFAPHIHAIGIGDRQATWGARQQVKEYFAGGDGLRGSRRDIHLGATGHGIGRPVPTWAARYA